MKTEKRDTSPRVCSAEGCVRPVDRDERYCETCTIEWTLYRRDRRDRQTDPSARPVG